VHGARRHIALQPHNDFFQDRATIGALPKPHDCEQHRLLERTKNVSHAL
jgi:hypothetical protein